MKFPMNMPLKLRIMAVCMLTITIAMLVMSAVFLLNEFRTLRQSLIANLQMQASIIGHNTTAALLFMDRRDAAATLSAFDTQRQIRQAILYDGENQIFATYQKKDAADLEPPSYFPPEDGHIALPGGLGFFYHIRIDDKKIGTLYIASDMTELYDRLMSTFVIMGGVVLFSILLGYVLIARLQGSIVNPINNLVASMRSVEEDRNYALRVSSESSDELGALAEQFNKMLGEVEKRDAALHQHGERLEHEVSLRTKDLKRAKDMLETELKDRKAAEVARQESELRYKTLFDSSADAIFIVAAEGNDQGTIISANAAAARMHGYALQELAGLAYHDLGSPAAGRPPEHLYSDLLPGDKRTFEALHRKKDGSEFLIEVTANTFILAGDKHVLAICRDISERKKAEHKRQELEERLHRAQKMEALGLMAGGVAHDLNNLLSGIVGYPDLLLMQLPPESPLRAYLSSMKKSGERAAEIVQDLLSLARRGVVEESIINLNAVIRDYLNSPAVDALKQRVPFVRIAAKYDEQLLNIVGSAAHFSKAVMNLVTNAAEAIPGTGEVLIETQNRYVEKEEILFPDMKEGDCVLLQIADTGEGMEEEDLARIFEPFYTTKGMGKSGTGLGLAIVWGVVQDYHGFIDVKSAKGKGTTFSIYLPATRREPQPGSRHVALEQLRGDGERILVVDDVEEQRNLALEILKQLNYDAVAVPGGEEAVAYVKSNHVDLVMLDMIMSPGIDGLETYRRLVQVDPKCRAIVVSGYSESDRVREAQKLGAGAYLKKPYVIQHLGLTIRRELGKKTDSD